ncbi:MAG: TetR/AcrR family transcriptional regulator [Desulfobacterota bacterium]|nr:TetR/AcrR family transcriptional regulator [Thermodesulfobacteriota bacterium]
MTQKKAPEIRKEEIFEAALRCCNEKGYFNTSIEDIAQRAEISKGGIYHHFKSKKDLFIELFHTVADRYFESLRKEVHLTKDPTEQLHEMVRKSEEVFHKHYDILKFCLEFITLGTRDPEIREEVTKFYKTRVALFAQKLDEGVIAGIYKKIPVTGVARTLYFLSMGFFLTFFTVAVDFEPIQQHTINLQTIINGIRRER